MPESPDLGDMGNPLGLRQDPLKLPTELPGAAIGEPNPMPESPDLGDMGDPLGLRPLPSLAQLRSRVRQRPAEEPESRPLRLEEEEEDDFADVEALAGPRGEPGTRRNAIGGRRNGTRKNRSAPLAKLIHSKLRSFAVQDIREALHSQPELIHYLENHVPKAVSLHPKKGYELSITFVAPENVTVWIQCS
jgi:hypothetical protein